MINLHKRMLLTTRRGSNPQPPDLQSDAHPSEPPRPVGVRTVKNQISQQNRSLISAFESNLNSSNTDGSFTMAYSNSFLSPYKILPIAKENK